VVLDGDEMREILGSRDYSWQGRTSFYEVLAALAALLARQEVIVLVPATAHRREYREHARRVSPRFLEVYVSTPTEECARRDPKGLYARARTDPNVELPGISVVYEPPSSPDVVAEGGHDSRAVDAILKLLE
jgi:adenylylsulfate kinase